MTKSLGKPEPIFMFNAKPWYKSKTIFYCSVVVVVALVQGSVLIFSAPTHNPHMAAIASCVVQIVASVLAGYHRVVANKSILPLTVPFLGWRIT